MPWLLTSLIVRLMNALQDILAKVITLTNTSPETALCYPHRSSHFIFSHFFNFFWCFNFFFHWVLLMPSGSVSIENWTTHSAQSSLGPTAAVSGGSVRQRVDYGGECVLPYLSPLSAASVWINLWGAVCVKIQKQSMLWNGVDVMRRYEMSRRYEMESTS